MPNVVKNIVYKTNATLPEDQSLDLYYPSREIVNPPLLVFVHGGLWLDRDKSQYENVGTQFAENGFAVAVINYRKSKRGVFEGEFIHPVHVNDFLDSLRYLYKMPDPKYDLNNVFLFGHSCGAHIISLPFLTRKIYLKGESMVPKGIIGLQGIYDTGLFVQTSPEWKTDLESVFSKNSRNWESPQHAYDFAGHTETSWLIMHSHEDAWVNKNQAQNMYRHLQEIDFRDIALEESIVGNHDDGVSKIGTVYDKVSPIITSFISSRTKK